MRLVKSAMVAAAVMTAAPSLAQADTKSEVSGFVNLVQRLATHYALLTARSFVDLTWENLTVEPGTNQMVITGLKVFPIAEWDKDGKCQVTIDRVTAGDVYSFEKASTGWQISGVKVPAACFPPMAAQPMAGMKYEGLEIDNLSMEISYKLPDSSAELVIHAGIKDVADITATAEFGYLWFNIPLSGRGDPKPVVHLKKAEVAFTNRGIFERIEPMAAGQMGGDLTAVAPMLKQQLGFLLSQGGSRQPTAAENAFLDNLANEIVRFVKAKDALVVTAAPVGGVWLDEKAFRNASTAIAALAPRVSAAPDALRAIIPPADLKSAMADGANPDDVTRMKIGRALVTGVGAPLAVESGARLLAPLAKKGNGEAALLLAEAGENLGETSDAYEMALIALGAGRTAALSVADRLEAKMDLKDVFQLQKRVLRNGWAGSKEAEAKAEAAVKAGDLGYIRSLASAASVGSGMPRNYLVAYTAATLAAAGGDRGSASLRARMDARFAAREGWKEMTKRAASEALVAWNGGFGAALAAKVK